MVRLNDLFAVKQPDAEALLLGRLKCPEQLIFDEFFGHAAAVVTDRETHPSPLINRCHADPANAIHRFCSVHN